MDLDPAMVRSLLSAWDEREETMASRFTTEQELLAEILELLSIMRVEALAMSGSVKKYDLPDVIQVPRPGTVPVDPIPVVTPREFSRMMMVA